MFSLMSRIFIDGRKNVGNCEDSPPTGENNSSFSFFIHLVIKTFVRKFFSFGYRHKKRQKSPEFIYIFTRFRTWKLFVFYSPGKKITASQKKLFSHLWKHSFNLISGRKNVFHSWEEKKTPDIFSFFHVISQVEEKTKKLRKIFFKKRSMTHGKKNT